ncbi:MAG: CHAD domain-containing protein [Betaproteobacteria bacterium]|nr:CHAD domain-containing protein [Betaproteobacteria bacterium]
MANEIELKLSLTVDAQNQMLRQPLLRKAVAKRTQQLINLYYDTPTLDLHERGIALRLRKQGHAWLQTVKCAGSSAAGLTSRPEWETPYAGHFDFSAIDAKSVRRWLERPRISTQLAPLFETNFRRTTWRFEPGSGCVVLLMLDRGWIAAKGKLETISEVEIELASGNINELFKLAQTLAERLALVPAILSKAERGYRLFRGIAASPAKAQTAKLHAEDAPLAAFRKIALASLEHLQGNFDGALSSNDPEFIHQMRVATRRLRSALRLFAPRLPPRLAEQILPELRILTGRLGQARDFDVLLTEIAAPVLHAVPGEPRLAALIGAVTQRQNTAREAAVKHLQSIAYSRLLLHTTALLHKPPFSDTDCAAAADAETLGSFARTRLKRLRKKVLTLATLAAIDDPVSLHRLRIGIKRLRYALEFFSPLLADKPLQSLLAELARLQDELGQLNDLANAGLQLMHCAGEDQPLREAVSLVGGWHALRHRELLGRIAEQVQRLSRLKLPRQD